MKQRLPKYHPDARKRDSLFYFTEKHGGGTEEHGVGIWREASWGGGLIDPLVRPVLRALRLRSGRQPGAAFLCLSGRDNRLVRRSLVPFFLPRPCRAPSSTPRLNFSTSKKKPAPDALFLEKRAILHETAFSYPLILPRMT